MTTELAEPIESERAIIGYSPPLPSDASRIVRGILAIGVIHGLACSAYVAQRTVRWLVTGSDVLDDSQSPTFAGVGLTAQMILGVLLAACCFACIYRPGDALRHAAAVAAVLLGTTWYGFGLADYLPTFVGANRESMTVFDLSREIVGNLCRESNQAIVPALVVFACMRRRSERSLARAVQVGIIVSCFTFAAPLLDLYYVRENGLGGNPRYQVERWTAAGVLMLVGLVLFFVRRPWRLLAALPLAALLAKNLYVDRALRPSLLMAAPSFDNVVLILRQMSFLLIVTSAAMAGFVAFTLLKTPHPKAIDSFR